MSPSSRVRGHVTDAAAFLKRNPARLLRFAFAARGRKGGVHMLEFAIIAAVVSVIAGAMGWGGLSAGAAGVAKLVFIVFLMMFLVAVLLLILGIQIAT